MSELAVGSAAPDFNLEADGGQRVKLSDFSGRPVVVYFYPKDNTPGCTKQAIGFTDLAAEFEKLDVTIIGISPDSVAKHDKFIAKHDLKLKLGADPDQEASNAYGVWVEKSMYGKKYMGVERSTFLIDKSGKIANLWRKVKIPGHVEAVLEAAQDL
ncbi:thioredoxin-dependent thiol peroxidase [Roseibium algae]|uniref:thioredoxin-dependent peroxiredoxin n=1 Tax=Roseibium algae TaxID=3123038 RepID=A0ABU8TKJ3_9HYPH